MGVRMGYLIRLMMQLNTLISYMQCAGHIHVLMISFLIERRR